MAYDQPQREAQMSHLVTMEDRKKLSLSGVVDVSGFDEELVVLSTSLGMLTIRGEQMHIERIDLDTGLLELHGRIRELSYEEQTQPGSLWSRLFG